METLMYKGLKSVPLGSMGEEEDEEEEERVQTPPAAGGEEGRPTAAAAAAEEGGGGKGEMESLAMEEFSSAYQTVMRLLENGERISAMYRCARIQGAVI
jgi:hypothetical protein